MEWFIAVTQVVLLLALYLGWRWLKALPESLHRRQEQVFQQRLKRELEEFRNTLARELELFKISHAQLQVHKTEEFTSFTKLQQRLLTDVAFQTELKSGNRKAVDELQKAALELATGLFLFASDETVRQYRDWKIGSASGKLSGKEMLLEIGNLMVALRKDLGYQQTELKAADYLRLFITDWDTFESDTTAGGTGS